MNIVRQIYIVPTDKVAFAAGMISEAAQHIQAWYQKQVGMDKTFKLNNPIVQTFFSTHNSDWFSTNPNPIPPQADWINNAVADAVSFLGARPANETWAIWVDAIPGTGQNSGSFLGVATLNGNDLSGITSHGPNPVCWTIGGAAHEHGHGFGLHHPDPNDPQWGTALMGVGYTLYPSCILRTQDLTTLNASVFFATQTAMKPPMGLCPFE